MACEGNWSVKVTCLPFLSVVGWTFVLTSPEFRPRVSSSSSFAPLIARSRRGSGRMPAWFGVELACMLVV